MDWITIVTIVVAAWAVLRILGGERQRLIQIAEAEADRKAADNS